VVQYLSGSGGKSAGNEVGKGSFAFAFIIGKFGSIG
jgi:hypothetical protein